MLRGPQGKEYISVLSSRPAVLIWRSIGYKFEPLDDPPPIDDEEARRREEEELQRVLELSVQDKGGRKNWNEYSLASSSGAGGSSGSGSQANTQASTARQQPAVPSSSSSSAPAFHQHAHSTGYVPSTEMHVQTTAPATVESSSPQSSSNSAAPTSPTPSSAEGHAVTRVRALHSFQPSEPNELAFEKGDIIKVVNREYKDWWRGQIRGRTGIFPVNYVVRSLHVCLLSVLTFWRCSGTSSGTHNNRVGSRSTARSHRVLTSGQC
jgi:signal transducing adaptor molecule